MALINKTKSVQVIKIIMSDGRKDSVNLQPNGRIKELPPGARIDPAYEKQYESVLTDTSKSSATK